MTANNKMRNKIETAEEGAGVLKLNIKPNQTKPNETSNRLCFDKLKFYMSVVNSRYKKDTSIAE